MASSYYDSSGKEVVDGDIAYANDLNDINTSVDTGFQLVEAALTSLGLNISYYSDLSEKWAENPEDSAVTPGKYSSLHWAAKSTASAGTASSAASTATTKASEALGSANSASSSAGTATTQAGIATSAAGTATTQAGIATAQAVIATTKASEANISALAAQAAMTGKADLASPTFTGVPLAPTAAGGTNTTQIATTAFVTSAVSPKAPTASPTFTGVPAAPTAAVGTNTTQLATTAFVQAEIDATPVPDNENAIIDGGFNIWFEGTSQTSSGYGSDTMWVNENVGVTKSHTRQTFTLGQTSVAGNPKYYSRTVVTNVSGVGNYCRKSQRIEDVNKYSGKTITISFDAKADASKNIALSLDQYFGSTGSPSTTVSGIGAQLVALTTSWVRQAITIAIPSISGKTLGSDGNDYMALHFWFNAGSNFNTQTASLGQQSGTFELSNVRIDVGSVDSDFEIQNIANTTAKVNRYFHTTKDADSNGFILYVDGYTVASGTGTIVYTFPEVMRSLPVISQTGSFSVFNCAQPVLTNRNKVTCTLTVLVTATGRFYAYSNGTSIYLDFDARL